jgi:SAM-dependent methyltransferase
VTFYFDDLDMLGNALLPKRWIFAKTMPQNPHYYTLRKEWRNDPLFDEVVRVMRKIGYVEYWHGKPFTMVNINGYKYWTMGAPVSETILINRAQINKPSPYDIIADKYDGMFSDPQSLRENEEVINLINYKNESILDIGCGSGLLFDYIKPVNYIGIDPSAEMLALFNKNYPSVATIQTPFEEYAGNKVDLVVSLFGSANYIHPDSISRICNMGSRWFIMFFKDNYIPVTYIKSGITIEHFTNNHLLLKGDISEFGNFWIIQGRDENIS